MRDDKEVMENPYLQSRVWAGRGGGTLAQSWRLGNAKTCQNDEFPDSFAPLTTLWASHISPRRSSGYRAILLVLLAVEPRIADLPVMMRKIPNWDLILARHDELIGSLGQLMAETPN
jgi:hypothetical protein